MYPQKFVLWIVSLVLVGSALAADPAEMVLIHPECGVSWFDSGLRATLLENSFISNVDQITSGTLLSPDNNRPASLGEVPGNQTNMNHWILWFNDYLAALLRHESTDQNRIILFHSCFKASSIERDGTGLGNPFSKDRTLVNYQAIFRHPSGYGSTYRFQNEQYKALEEIFAEHPKVLFIPVAPPPLHERETTQRNAERARTFSNWLENEWLTSYQERNPRLHNVLVFNWFDALANPVDGPGIPNTLNSLYAGGPTGTSQLNQTGHNFSSKKLAGKDEGQLRASWELFSQFVSFFSQFGGGGGFSSQALLTNPSSSETVSGTFEFFNDAGEPLVVEDSTGSQLSQLAFAIPPRGRFAFTAAQSGDLAVGSALVISSEPVGGVVRFRIPGRGIAGVGKSEPVRAFITPVRRVSEQVDTGIAVTNTQGTPVGLTFQLLDASGQEVPGGSTSIGEFSANGHLAVYISELFPEADTEDFEGSLVVEADGGLIAATALELGTSSGEFTTLPVTPID